MSTHTHKCRLCPADIECSQGDGCRLVDLLCRDCEAALEDVDELPTAKRSPLSFDRLARVIGDAVARARAADPSSQLHIFGRIVDTMLPLDPLDDTLDGWARRGAVFGARDAWTGSSAKVMPKDAPTQETTAMYCSAYCSAFFLTNAIRQRIHP